MASQPSYADLLVENERLRKRIDELERSRTTIKQPEDQREQFSIDSPTRYTPYHSLSSSQIQRYSRQLILPEIGVDAQVRICNAKVLVIGAGGLGAPVCLYLAAAGIGSLGIVDADVVEVDNLHRQIIHSQQTIGKPKAESARDACLRLNPSISVIAYGDRFTSLNAMELAQKYDILVDASDNVPTRYLVNDVGILCKKPVVSGSALRLEGQVTVYGYQGGPCYRCIYPQPPPPLAVTNCSDGGVLGCITGIVGSVQALEVLKIIGQLNAETLSQKLLLIDALTNRYMCVKLRPRNPKCIVCGDQPTLSHLIDYEEFCGGAASHDKMLALSQPPAGKTTKEDIELRPAIAIPSFLHLPAVPSISIRDYCQRIFPKQEHILLDVREPVQYQICSLPGAKNIPLRNLKQCLALVAKAMVAGPRVLESNESNQTTSSDPVIQLTEDQKFPVYVLCRRGIDSIRATRLMLDSIVPVSSDQRLTVLNLAGGLVSFQRFVDPKFPTY